MKAGGRMFDVSHTIEHGMATYEGLPAPVTCDGLRREATFPVRAFALV